MAAAYLALALVLAAALPDRAWAELFAVAVPEVVAPYSDLGETRSGNFDLGVDLVSVESVRLRLTWQDLVIPFCAGFNCHPGSAFLIGIREPRDPADPPPVFADINSVFPFEGVQELRAEFLFASEPLILLPIDRGFEIVLDPSPLEVLGDGEASLAVRLIAGTGTLTSAEVLVEAVAAPEPSGLGAVAVLAIAVIRRLRSSGSRGVAPCLLEA